MIFNSPEFIFFIAFGLIFYSLTPARAKRYALLLICLTWYASWCLAWPAIILAAAAVNFLLLKLTRGRTAKTAGLIYGSIILFDVAFLVALKCIPQFQSYIQSWPTWILRPETPFGSSFFTFLMIGFVVDRWRSSKRGVDENALDFLIYVSFFPMLVSGPLERFSDLKGQLRKLGPLDFGNITDGILIFTLGFLKKQWITQPLTEPVKALLAGKYSGWSYLIAGGFLATIQAYAELSAYADMGRGIARCFGIRLQLNFRAVFLSLDPSEFWMRWNLTLGTWIRDYVTLPLMLRWGRLVNRYILVLLAFVILGLWHGLAPHWLCFGVFDGVLVILFLSAKNGWLAGNPRFVHLFGIALVISLYVGNGVLQNPDSIALLRAAWASRAWGSEVFVHLRSLLIPHPWLGLSFLALMACDFLQERAFKGDFVFAVNPLGKTVLAAVSVGLFLIMMREGTFFDLGELPPLYFRL